MGEGLYMAERSYYNTGKKRHHSPYPPKFSQRSSSLLVRESLRASTSTWQLPSRHQLLWMVQTHGGNKMVMIHHQDCTFSDMAHHTSSARKGHLCGSWKGCCLSAHSPFPRPPCTFMEDHPKIRWKRILVAVSNLTGNPAALVSQTAVWEALEPSSMAATSGRTMV